MKDGLSLSDPALSDHVAAIDQYRIKNPDDDSSFAFAGIFPTNYVYNIHFGGGVDWLHLLLVPSLSYDIADKSLILRFNYTEQRELYEIKKFLANKDVANYPARTALSNFYDAATLAPNNDATTGCKFGEWMHDSTNKLLYVCINGKTRSS